MKTKNILIYVGIALLILVGGSVLAYNMEESNSISPTENAKVEVSDTSFNWGDIKIDAGNVEHSFQITNRGEDTLKLFDVTTSCMCTTATLSYGGTESPLFGMHTKSSYVLEIPPGESANINVVFDPAYHGPNGVGPITRQVMISTNDSSRDQLVLTLTANVTR